jgi:arylsulfatase A
VAARNLHLPILVCLLAVCSWAAERPNILLILGDDIGREVIGAYGGESYATPHIDRLAASGMKFNLCYATPMCSPTRVELLTGRYSFRNYVQWRGLDPKERTFAQILRQAGYKTAHAGKWQFEGYDQRPPLIERSGFDEYLSIDEVYQLEAEKRGEGNVFWNPLLWRNGERTMGGNTYSPELVTDFLVDFMERNREGPFLAYYCMNLLHRPFMPTPDSSAIRQHGDAAYRGRRGDAGHFPDMVTYADKMVGKLVSALDELGLRENTLVIFTSDNGTDNVNEAKPLRSSFHGRSIAGGKYLVSDLGVHVPFIANWPGQVEAGTVYQHPIDFTDILPTLCELAGVEAPRVTDGHSLLPHLLGLSAEPRKWIYSWGGFIHTSRKYKDPRAYRADQIHVVRDQRWKLYSDGRLFEMTADQFEENPLPRGSSAEADQARVWLEGALEELRNSQPALW